MAKKLKINGPIIPNNYKWIYTWFGIDATCPKDVEDAIEAANGEEIELEINSGGGDVYSGSEMYTKLKEYGNVTGKIPSIAASAASLPACACKVLKISPTAQIMIHNVKSGVDGDHRDMEHQAGVLKGWDKSIANAYILKTGMEQKELLGLMGKETWLTAQEAKEKGFVDEIMFDEGLKLVASANVNLDGTIPQKVIDKMINEFKGKNFQNSTGQKPNEYKPKNEEKGAEAKMTLEELKNSDPELYNSIVNTAKNEGKKEGAQEERTRLQKIDEISNNLEPELVNKAKYIEPMNAEALAFEAIKADKAKGQNYLNNAQIDSTNSGTENVGGAPVNNGGEEKPKTAAEKFMNIAGRFDASRRGVKE